MADMKSTSYSSRTCSASCVKSKAWPDSFFHAKNTPILTLMCHHANWDIQYSKFVYLAPMKKKT